MRTMTSLCIKQQGQEDRINQVDDKIEMKVNKEVDQLKRGN